MLAVGRLLHVPIPVLGATVLSWGNSMSDAVCNLKMASDGYPTMAVTACFASPIFILLAGAWPGVCVCVFELGRAWYVRVCVHVCVCVCMEGLKVWDV